MHVCKGEWLLSSALASCMTPATETAPFSSPAGLPPSCQHKHPPGSLAPSNPSSSSPPKQLLRGCPAAGNLASAPAGQASAAANASGLTAATEQVAGIAKQAALLLPMRLRPC